MINIKILKKNIEVLEKLKEIYKHNLKDVRIRLKEKYRKLKKYRAKYEQ